MTTLTAFQWRQRMRQAAQRYDLPDLRNDAQLQSYRDINVKRREARRFLLRNSNWRVRIARIPALIANHRRQVC